MKKCLVMGLMASLLMGLGGVTQATGDAVCKVSNILVDIPCQPGDVIWMVPAALKDFKTAEEGYTHILTLCDVEKPIVLEEGVGVYCVYKKKPFKDFTAKEPEPKK